MEKAKKKLFIYNAAQNPQPVIFKNCFSCMPYLLKYNK